MQESSAKNFLNAKFPTARLSEDFMLTSLKYKSAEKSSDVVGANFFHQIFENQHSAEKNAK